MKKVMACAVLIVLIALGFGWNGSADEFMAMPGFWKIITKTSVTDAPQIKWVCVGEAADPWVSFAHLGLIPQLSCKRDDFERTSTTLKWQLDYIGPFIISNTGALVFDTAKHFTGQVHLRDAIMGYPID